MQFYMLTIALCTLVKAVRRTAVGLVVALAITPVPAGAVLTAIVDSGIKSSDRLTLPIDEGVLEYDFVRNDNIADDKTYNRHGTFMARTFNQVAATERIMPLKVTEGQKLPTLHPHTQKALLPRVNAALTLVNNTPAVSIVLLNRAWPVDTALLKTAASKGKVVVINAGNKGQNEPKNTAKKIPLLNGAGIIVGGHTAKGVIAGISNRAGSLKEYYLTALYSMEGTKTVGSSFASARVAAVAAMIRSQNPQLSNAQVTALLFSTATDAGAAGVDEIYGWGLLNKSRALNPVGDITVPTEETSEETTEESADESSDENVAGSAGGSGAVLAALVVGGAGYALLGNNPDLKKTLVLDEYGRAYELDLETRVTIRHPGASAGSVLEGLDNKQTEETLIKRSDFQLTARYRTLAANRFSAGVGSNSVDEARTRLAGMSFTGHHTDGFRYAFGLNDPLTEFFDNQPGAAPSDGYLMAFQTDAFQSPLLGYANQGLHGALGFSPRSRWQTGLTFSSANDGRRYGLKSDSASLNAGYRKDRWGVNLQMGLLAEDGNLLGGASAGALSVDTATTFSANLAGHVNLHQKWAMVANYTDSLTQVDDRANSLLHDFSSLRNNSWGVGLLGRNIVAADDAIGMAWSRPLRTHAGDVTVSVPWRRDLSGQIHYKTARTSLVPDGAEHLLELFYRRQLTRQLQLFAYLAHRTEPLHRQSARPESSILALIRYRP